MYLDQADKEKFQGSLKKGQGCWEWTQGKDRKGYGVFYANGISYKAHRVSYSISTGDPTGQLVCHTCDNPSCVNPEHLFLGSIQDNNRDRHRKGRSRNKPTPGEAHHGAKLTEIQVQEIRTLKTPLKTLASLYKVSEAQISRIRNYKTWVHI